MGAWELGVRAGKYQAGFRIRRRWLQNEEGAWRHRMLPGISELSAAHIAADQWKALCGTDLRWTETVDVIPRTIRLCRVCSARANKIDFELARVR